MAPRGLTSPQQSASARLRLACADSVVQARGGERRTGGEVLGGGALQVAPRGAGAHELREDVDDVEEAVVAHYGLARAAQRGHEARKAARRLRARAARRRVRMGASTKLI